MQGVRYILFIDNMIKTISKFFFKRKAGLYGPAFPGWNNG
jgi:hypothetical protein